MLLTNHDYPKGNDLVIVQQGLSLSLYIYQIHTMLKRDIKITRDNY